MTAVIDSDQHLFEPRTLWADHADPGARDRALAIVDDEVGTAWLTWQGQRLLPADVQVPGETDAIGARFQRAKRGLPPEQRYDDALPPSYWDPQARLAALADLGVDETVLFPNYGLVWEQDLARDLAATITNMGAWNRWAMAVAAEGRGRLHPVAHLTLRDQAWLEGQLGALAAAGVRLAMIAPALVDGRPLSHPDLDRVWSAFVEHGVTPVFHVANQPRPFDDAWYASDPEPSNPVLSSVFLWVPAALSLADLALNGTLARHPDLRIGVMELSAVWLPMFLQYLDGGNAFVSRLHGASIADLDRAPSEYVRSQTRIAAFSYEQPGHLKRRTGDVFMACSDWPHSEGTASPIDDYRATGATIDEEPALFHDNIAWLLRKDLIA
jgi:predicted TIM-barrel fold metal-dependent hydrolase